MWQINKDIIYFKFIIILTSLKYSRGSIDGNFIPTESRPNEYRKECNPLYWYPRHIPEYCYYKIEITQKSPKEIMNSPEIPLPIPLPILPKAPISPIVQIPSSLDPVSQFYPAIFSQPTFQLPYPLPFGIPIIPTNPMLPIAGIPMSMYSSKLSTSHLPQYIPPFASNIYQAICRRKTVHGLPDIMTPNGGMNILPFTDVIKDLLQEHKKKIIMKHLKQMSNEYDHMTSNDSYYSQGRIQD